MCGSCGTGEGEGIPFIINKIYFLHLYLFLHIAGVCHACQSWVCCTHPCQCYLHQSLQCHIWTDISMAGELLFWMHRIFINRYDTHDGHSCIVKIDTLNHTWNICRCHYNNICVHIPWMQTNWAQQWGKVKNYREITLVIVISPCLWWYDKTNCVGMNTFDCRRIWMLLL